MIKNFKLNFILLCRGIIIIFPLVLILFLSVVFQEKIVINSTYPEQVEASKPFNVYNGESALTVKGVGFVNGDVIYIDDKPQKTTYGNSELLTCIVDREIYKEPAVVKVKVVRKVKDKILLKSNTHKLEIVEK